MVLLRINQVLPSTTVVPRPVLTESPTGDRDVDALTEFWSGKRMFSLGYNVDRDRQIVPSAVARYPYSADAPHKWLVGGAFRVTAAGELSEVALLPGDEIAVQDVEVAGEWVLYDYWDDATAGYGMRVVVDGATRQLLPPLVTDGARLGPFNADDGTHLVWLEEVLAPGESIVRRVFRSPLVARPADLEPQLVTEMEATGVERCGFGYCAFVTRDLATAVRLSDGARWSLPAPEGASYELEGPAFVAPEELGLYLQETVGSGRPRTRGLRLLRWDSLGAPDA